MSVSKSSEEAVLMAAGDQLDSQVPESDAANGRPRFKRAEKVSLLEANRLRNLGKRFVHLRFQARAL